MKAALHDLFGYAATEYGNLNMNDIAHLSNLTSDKGFTRS